MIALEEENDLSGYLEGHDISMSYRAKMVDWMMEVLSTFKMSDQTVFLAVSLMDRYFKYTDESLQGSDLHLTGVAAMFLASKYEDIEPLFMRTVVKKVGHSKFTPEEIT